MSAGQENKDNGITSADHLGSKQQAAAEQQYDLHRKTAAVVASHDAFAEAFAGYAVQMDDYRMTGRPVAPQVWLTSCSVANLQLMSAHPLQHIKLQENPLC